jgi:hypothetical protein
MEAAAAAAGGGSSSSLVFRGCPLPPGFRFQPTDQEIIVYYLKKKIAAAAAAVTSIIADVDIYKFDPWELPGTVLATLLVCSFSSFTGRPWSISTCLRPGHYSDPLRLAAAISFNFP